MEFQQQIMVLEKAGNDEGVMDFSFRDKKCRKKRLFIFHSYMTEYQ